MVGISCHRMEVYCAARDARHVIDAARAFGIAAQAIGRTEKSTDGRNRLSLQHGAQTLRYEAPPV